jgi:hypothetical protein
LLLRIVGSGGQISVRGDRATIEQWSGATRELNSPAAAETSLDRAVREIVQCLTTGSKSASSGEDGLAALELIIGFHLSNRLRGQWVDLPIRGADRDLEVLIG